MKKSNFVNIQAYKYNGSLYRQWNGAKIISDDKDYLVLFLRKTKVSEVKKNNKNQNWIVSFPTLWFFSKKYFYNFTVTLKSWDEISYYVNMASPLFQEDNTIKYIDFDYDIKTSNSTEKLFSIIDHKDFATNSKKWYDSEIEEIIYKTLSFLCEKIAKNEEFFNIEKLKKIINYLIRNKFLFEDELKAKV